MTATSITAFFRANGDQFISTVGRMERSTGRFERNASGSIGAVSRQMRALGGAFAGLSTAVAVRELGRFAESAQRLDNLLIAAGDNSDDFKRRLLATAIDTRAPIEGLANALLRLQKADPSASLEQSLERVATFQRLSLFGGRTAQEASSAALQLSQAIQSGQLSGDEFRSISENAAPEYLNELARLAGVARSELKATASQGKLTSDLLIQALDNLSGYSQEVVAELPRTLSQAATAVSDAFTVLVGGVDDSLGVTERLAGILGGLADLFVVGSEHAELLATSFRLLANAMIAIAGGRVVGNLTGAIGRATAATAAQTAALEANRQKLAQSRRATLEKAAAQRQLARLRQETVASLRAEGVAQSRINRAQIQAATAQNRYTTARRRALAVALDYRGAVSQVGAATAEATRQTSRWAIAGRGIGGLINLFGGVTGAIVAAGFAAFTLYRRFNDVEGAVRKASDAISELDGATDKQQTAVEQLASKTEELRQAEVSLAEAVETRGETSVTAAEDAITALKGEIAELQTLTEDYLALARVKAAIAQDEQEDAEAKLRSDAIQILQRQGIDVDRDRSDLDLITEAAASLNSYLADGGTLGATTLELQERFLTTISNARSLAEFLALIEDKTDVISQHFERNAIATGQQATAAQGVTTALTTQEAVLARAEANEKRLNALVAERAILEAALAEPQRLSAEYANQLRRELEAVNAEIERFAPIVVGSQNDLEAMRGTAADLAATLQDAEFDQDGELARRAAEVTLRLEQAIAAGLDLNSVEMAALREELRSVEEQALNAAVAIASARAQARAGYEADDATFDPRGANYDPVNAAFEDFQGQRNLYTPPERVTVPSSGGSRRNRTATGGGLRQSEAQRQVEKDMETALNFIRSQRTEEEAQADRLTELLELRESLVDTYGDEADIVADLDTSLERMQRQSLDWAKSLTTDILKAVAAGEDLDQVLNLIFTRIFDAALSGVVDQVFGAIGSGAIGGGQSNSGGGGILKTIGSFFGFAKGGVMTPQGPVPLRKYAKGGVAHSPQLALFGEGSGAEAFVPLESGAIPVRLNFPNLDKIRDATSQTVSRNVNLVDNTVINITAPDGGNDALLSSLRRELTEREARLLQTIRAANEDDPSFLP